MLPHRPKTMPNIRDIDGKYTTLDCVKTCFVAVLCIILPMIALGALLWLLGRVF